MAMLTLIAARDRKGAIGRNNTIPWHVPEDFAFFKRETSGCAIIMGRKTWDSLPRKPLPNRLNIVVTRQMQDPAPNTLFLDLEQAIPQAKSAGHDHIFCIGGEQIYRQMLPLADRILLSTVETDIPDADAFFPEFSASEWRAVQTQILREADPRCSVTEYHRA